MVISQTPTSGVKITWLRRGIDCPNCHLMSHLSQSEASIRKYDQSEAGITRVDQLDASWVRHALLWTGSHTFRLSLSNPYQVWACYCPTIFHKWQKHLIDQLFGFQWWFHWNWKVLFKNTFCEHCLVVVPSVEQDAHHKEGWVLISSRVSQ